LTLQQKMHRLSSRKYDAIFFDFGDTLAFNNQTFPKSLHKIIKIIGININIEQLRSAILEADYGELSEERMKCREEESYRNFRIKYYKYVLKLIGYSHMQKYAEYMHNIISYYHITYLKPETLYVLDILSQESYKLGIVSNFSHTLPRICDELGLTEKFDFITYSDDVGYEKPKEQIFNHALAKACVEPDRVIHIGDSYGADVLGAKALGITPILLLNDNDESYEECICVDNLIDILNILGIKHKYSFESI
jgi:putative hydrolase of the HAD superfamily